jgi:hypothetical protein
MRRIVTLWLYVLLLVICAAVAIISACVLIRGKAVEAEQSRTARKEVDEFKLRLNIYADVRREQMDRIRGLVNDHKFLQAALLLEDLAATERTLVGWPKAYSPSIEEEEALRYMKEAGYAKLYTDYVRLRYPTAFQDEDVSKDRKKEK